MKKLVAAAIIGTAGLFLAVGTSYGQGTIFLNAYDSGNGFIQGPTGTAGAPVGTFIQVLVGASANSLTPIFNVVTSGSPTSVFTVGSGDINGDSPNGSSFDFGYGHVTTVAAGGSAFIQVIAWEGASSYAAAMAQNGAFVGASAVFSQVTGTSPAPPGLPAPTILAIPGVIHLLPVVPEPSTIALGGLSAAALLLFRRKK